MTTAPVTAVKTTAQATVPASTTTTSPAVGITIPLKLRSTLATLAGGAAENGQASWFHAPDGTCAHQTLPFGTLIKVTSLSTGTSTTCTVDDRGPFITGRVIDLSYDTFEKLAHPGSSVIDVVIEW